MKESELIGLAVLGLFCLFGPFIAYYIDAFVDHVRKGM